jgi:hypothetical protein
MEQEWKTYIKPHTRTEQEKIPADTNIDFILSVQYIYNVMNFNIRQTQFQAKKKKCY